MLISSSTVQGLLTCPLMLKSLVPLFLWRPKPRNQSPPRLQIVGATATVSTLVTVVGQPNTPTSASFCPIPTITPWWRGRPTMGGKTALGASSPANPALHMPEPLSQARAATSSSHIFGYLIDPYNGV